MTGWDVAELQFALAWHGFPNAAIDGGFGRHVKHALIKFQRWAHLAPDASPVPALSAPEAPLPRLPNPPRWPLQAAVAARSAPGASPSTRASTAGGDGDAGRRGRAGHVS